MVNGINGYKPLLTLLFVNITLGKPPFSIGNPWKITLFHRKPYLSHSRGTTRSWFPRLEDHASRPRRPGPAAVPVAAGSTEGGAFTRLMAKSADASGSIHDGMIMYDMVGLKSSFSMGKMVYMHI